MVAIELQLNIVNLAALICLRFLCEKRFTQEVSFINFINEEVKMLGKSFSFSVCELK